MNSEVKSNNSDMKDNKKVKDKGGKLTYYHFFWIFFIGSFIGVMVETVWCLYRHGRIESRAGLVYGPFNTVYGFGAVLMSFFAHKFGKKSLLFIFISCAFIGALFEYVCSIFQELVFKTVSWDYTLDAFNILGRTNLLYAFMWGALGFWWVKFFYPWYYEKIEKTHKTPKFWLTIACSFFMLFNIAVSLVAARRHTLRFEGKEPASSFDRYIDKRFPDKRMDKIFPNSVKADESPKNKKKAEI